MFFWSAFPLLFSLNYQSFDWGISVVSERPSPRKIQRSLFMHSIDFLPELKILAVFYVSGQVSIPAKQKLSICFCE